MDLAKKDENGDRYNPSIAQFEEMTGRENVTMVARLVTLWVRQSPGADDGVHDGLGLPRRAHLAR